MLLLNLLRGEHYKKQSVAFFSYFNNLGSATKRSCHDIMKKIELKISSSCFY